MGRGGDYSNARSCRECRRGKLVAQSASPSCRRPSGAFRVTSRRPPASHVSDRLARPCPFQFAPEKLVGDQERPDRRALAAAAGSDDSVNVRLQIGLLASSVMASDSWSSSVLTRRKTVSRQVAAHARGIKLTLRLQRRERDDEVRSWAVSGARLPQPALRKTPIAELCS